MAQRDADTYILAYTGYGSDGYVRSVDVSSTGSTITNRGNWEFNGSQGNHNSLVKGHGDDNIFINAYTGPNNDGYIRTYYFNTSGGLSWRQQWEHNTSNATYNSLIHLKDQIYVLAYAGASDKGKIETHSISANGYSWSELKSIDSDAGTGKWNALKKMTDSTVVLVYEASGPKFMAKTFLISSDGKNIVEKKTETIYEGKANWNAITQVDANTYLIATQGKDDDGYLYTYDIAPDGSSISKVRELEFDIEKSQHHSLYNAGSNSFLMTHSGTTNQRTYAKMFTVPADGNIIKQIYDTKINDYGMGQTSLARVDADTYLLAYSGSGTDGYLATLTVQAGDKILPVISFIALSDDNASVNVTFNEDVYASSTASGNLEVSDFALSINGGTATLSSATPTSISSDGKVFTLGISLSGTPDGSEVLKVSPV